MNNRPESTFEREYDMLRRLKEKDVFLKGRIPVGYKFKGVSDAYKEELEEQPGGWNAIHYTYEGYKVLIGRIHSPHIFKLSFR